MTKQTTEEEQLLDAVLPHVMFDGWSRLAITQAAKDLDIEVSEFDRLFPGGPRDLLKFFIELSDQQMEEELCKREVTSMKIRERITLAVRLRLEIYASHKDAIRKALTFFSLPQNAALGATLTAGTVSTSPWSVSHEHQFNASSTV